MVHYRDYSDQEWKSISDVRKKNRWEAPVSELTTRMTSRDHTGKSRYKKNTTQIAADICHTNYMTKWQLGVVSELDFLDVFCLFVCLHPRRFSKDVVEGLQVLFIFLLCHCLVVTTSAWWIAGMLQAVRCT